MSSIPPLYVVLRSRGVGWDRLCQWGVERKRAIKSEEQKCPHKTHIHHISNPPPTLRIQHHMPPRPYTLVSLLFAIFISFSSTFSLVSAVVRSSPTDRKLSLNMFENVPRAPEDSVFRIGRMVSVLGGCVGQLCPLHLNVLLSEMQGVE